MRPTLLAALLLVAACGETPRPKPPIYKYDYGPVAFRDDAPSNKTLSADELALAFVDHQGKPVDLKAYRGKKAVVLVVTRGIPESPGGTFCPHCVTQVAGLAASHAEFEKRDAAVLVVFPGPSERVAEFIQQTGGKAPGGFPFPLLLDKDTAAVGRLGIKGDLARPSTFIADKAGNVVYAFVGETSTDRPSLKAILAQLDRLPKT